MIIKKATIVHTNFSAYQLFQLLLILKRQNDIRSDTQAKCVYNAQWTHGRAAYNN